MYRNPNPNRGLSQIRRKIVLTFVAFFLILSCTVLQYKISTFYSRSSTHTSQFEESTYLLGVQSSANLTSIDVNNSFLGYSELPYTVAVLDLTPKELDGIPVWDDRTSYIHPKEADFELQDKKLLNNKTLLSGGKCSLLHKKTNKNTTDLDKGRCCIGATSKGGGVRYHGIELCSGGIDVYDVVKDLAMEELGIYPVQENSVNRSSIFSSCDVCQIIYILSSLKHNRMSFVGDSIQQQVWQGFECELLRRGFDIIDWYSMKWNIYNESDWQYGIKHVNCLKVMVPSWMKGNDSNIAESVDICHFKHYRPYRSMKEHKVIARMSDVIIFDWGLHYKSNDIREYGTSLMSFLNAMKNEDVIVMHRESTAQHFDGHGGEHLDGTPLDVCVPNNAEFESFRTRLLREVAAHCSVEVIETKELYSRNTLSTHRDHHLYMIPFYNFTSKLFQLHPKECTHYCHTPFLWLPIWRHIRLYFDYMNQSSMPKSDTM